MPGDYYDKKFFFNLGNKIGKAIKVDDLTLRRTRTMYARMCVEVDLNTPLLPSYVVDGNALKIEYEGLHLICFNCGKFGHSTEQCPLRKKLDAGPGLAGEGSPETGTAGQGTTSTEGTGELYRGWMLAYDPRKNKKGMARGGKTSDQSTKGGKGGLTPGHSRFGVLSTEECGSDDITSPGPTVAALRDISNIVNGGAKGQINSKNKKEANGGVRGEKGADKNSHSQGGGSRKGAASNLKILGSTTGAESSVPGLREKKGKQVDPIVGPRSEGRDMPGVRGEGETVELRGQGDCGTEGIIGKLVGSNEETVEVGPKGRSPVGGTDGPGGSKLQVGPSDPTLASPLLNLKPPDPCSRAQNMAAEDVEMAFLSPEGQGQQESTRSDAVQVCSLAQ